MDYNFVIETEFYCLQLKLLITMLFAEVLNSLHKDMRVYNKLTGPREIVILKFRYSGVRNKISVVNCFVWVWNLVFDINGRAQDKAVREYGAQEEVWKLEHNEDRHKMYSSPIIWVVKLRMRWAGDVAHLGEQKCIQFGWGILKGDHLENLGTYRIYSGPKT